MSPGKIFSRDGKRVGKSSNFFFKKKKIILFSLISPMKPQVAAAVQSKGQLKKNKQWLVSLTKLL